jgi:hypothetical protein
VNRDEALIRTDPGRTSPHVLWFVVHQYIATLGIDIFAEYLLGYGFDVLQLFGKHFPQHTMYWILTGTPYYPVQIGLGLLLGWLIGRRVQHRAMLWVWVLPCIYLTYALLKAHETFRHRIRLTGNSIPC